MARPEKVAAVAEIAERIEGAQAVFLAEYAGLSVKDQQELRRGLRAQGAEFKVLKMTLARRAAEQLGIDSLDELLLGPTGLAFADGDPVSAAKALKEFASSHEVFVVKGGLLGSDFLTAERISELADIAPREELLAMLAGALKAPITSMARLLAALPRGAVTAMQQLLEKKQSGEFVEAEATAPVGADEAPGPEADEDDGAPEAGADAAAAEEADEEAAADEAADEGDSDDTAAAEAAADSEDDDPAAAAEEE